MLLVIVVLLIFRGRLSNACLRRKQRRQQRKQRVQQAVDEADIARFTKLMGIEAAEKLNVMDLTTQIDVLRESMARGNV